MQPSILIADDHRLYADALRSLLTPNYGVAAIVTDGKQLIELARENEPDLVITDLSMPHVNGIDAILELKNSGSQSKFIVLTMYNDQSLAVLAFRVGASAFLLKTTRRDEFLSAVESVLNGQLYLGSQFVCGLDSVLAEAALRPLPPKGPLLSRRQREILRLKSQRTFPDFPN